MARLWKNLYDVLHAPPRLHKPLPPELEALAQAVVMNGKLRIDTETDANFVRMAVEGGLNIAYSKRELFDRTLVPRTHAALTALFSKRRMPEEAKVAAAQQIERMRAEAKKRGTVAEEVEIKLARALVLCNALPVIRLIHLEGAEIFISFGHAVGDVMDVATWRNHGQNSGLQSVGRSENAVYVSCGGDPFLDEEEHRHSGDGFAALARFMIIAAQETGHNADLIRHGGQVTGRYTLAGGRIAPSQAAGEGRRADLQRTDGFYARCRSLGLMRVAEWERQLKFYRDVKAVHLRRRAAWFKSRVGWLYLRRRFAQEGMKPLLTLQKNPYPAMQLRAFFEDMLFNLEPKADVYKRPDPVEEEAIACVEALARVPQQVVKWGRTSVEFCTTRLSSLYYGVIVPAAANAALRFRN